ncbi:MAG: hypothetical protein Q8S84_08265 [bacterium]|nr:hypothetical protein [bacterium]
MNHSEINISSSRLVVILIGCLCHRFWLGNCAVTSIFSSCSCLAYFASCISIAFFSTSFSISTFRLLAIGQIIFLSSFDKSFNHLRISLNFQLFPKKSFSNSSSFSIVFTVFILSRNNFFKFSNCSFILLFY